MIMTSTLWCNGTAPSQEPDAALAGWSVRQRGVLWLKGSGALGLGMLVYLCDRPASQALLMPQLGFLAGHSWFGIAGQWLPSFVHAFAFGLFSAALLAPRPRWVFGACGFWFAVNAAFEIGQHPQVRGPLAAALQRGFGEGPVVRACQNYFLRGTFDVADLVAAALGALLAAGVLHRLLIQRSENHAP
jgi:hypothetical protein